MPRLRKADKELLDVIGQTILEAAKDRTLLRVSVTTCMIGTTKAKGVLTSRFYFNEEQTTPANDKPTTGPKTT